MIRCFLACLFLLFVWDIPVQANDTVGPDWSSNQILDLNEQGREDAIVFEVRSDLNAIGKPSIITSGTVHLAKDFDYVSLGDNRTITDYKYCRVFSWSILETTFANDSCFAGPAFRAMELRNRLKLRELLSKVDPSLGQDAGLANPVLLEQEFAAQLSPSNPLSLSETENGLEWRLGELTVATLSQDGFAFDAQERGRFARYLSRYIKLHPQVRDAILDRGVFPSTIKIMRPAIEGTRTELLSFSPAKRSTVDYPLAPDMSSRLVKRSLGEDPEAMGLKKALSVIDGTIMLQKPSFQELLRGLEVLANDADSLATTLKFLELTQLYGPQLFTQPEMMDQLRQVMPSVIPLLDNGDGAILWAASNLAGSPGSGKEREAAAAYLVNATELDEMDFGTFRLLTFANLVRSSSDSGEWDSDDLDAAPPLTVAYWTHIAASPWSSNAFKDLGDTYHLQFDTHRAWQAWDLGRAIDPDWRNASMQSVADVEASLKVAMADNF